MKSFKDSTDRAWNIAVNGETIVRVKGLCGILLTDLISGTVANELAADPIRLLAVLYAVCKEDADAWKVDEPAFRKLIVGDSLDGAIDALIDEVVSFFPKSRREVAQEMVSKGRQVQTLATRRAMDEMAKHTPESLLEKVLGASSGNSPESSASIPSG